MDAEAVGTHLVGGHTRDTEEHCRYKDGQQITTWHVSVLLLVTCIYENLGLKLYTLKYVMTDVKNNLTRLSRDYRVRENLLFS